MASEKLPVIIAGAGLGGLAAALALTEHGIRVQILEQAGEFKELGAGIQIGPNVFRVFDVLGLTAKVKDKAVFPDHLVMMDGVSGEEVVRIDVKGKFVEHFQRPYGLIHRADLHRILVEACAASPLISLHTSRKVTEFVDHGQRVIVRTESGSHHEGRSLVGADGLWSSIRQEIIGDGRPRISGHIAYRAILPLKEVPEHLRLNDMVLWAGPRNILVHYPLRRFELFNLVATFRSDRYVEGWDVVADPGELHAAFEHVVSDVKAMLARVENWRMWVLCDRDPVHNWSRGRVTLLGDAAHPTLPYLAQGAAMALEDAVVLAGEIAAAEGDDAEAFRRYQNRRYLRTGRVQLMSRLYGEIYHTAGTAREIRNEVLKEHSPEAIWEAHDWLYRGV